MNTDVRERIERYIELTSIPDDIGNLYDMRFDEWKALADCNQPINVIALAFNYGKAKGYRAAKAEARK
jgi:hypothetical protein